jgi:hypothetical protein
MNDCLASRAVALRRNENEKTVEKNNDRGQGKVECKKMNVKVEEKDEDREKVRKIDERTNRALGRQHDLRVRSPSICLGTADTILRF